MITVIFPSSVKMFGDKALVTESFLFFIHILESLVNDRKKSPEVESFASLL